MARSSVVTVRELVAALDGDFNFASASAWDVNGLGVGDADAEITGVAVALDPTLAALTEAVALGANVLLTHHPLLLDPLHSVSPQGSYPAEVAFSAIEAGVALVNVHTPLDLAPAALRLTGDRLGLTFDGPLDARQPDSLFGSDTPDAGLRYGVRWTTELSGVGATVADVHRAAVAAYGPGVRAWGDPRQAVSLVVTGTGSITSLIDGSLAAGADLLVGGEVKYHACLEALDRGMAIIELGHDRSEYPLVPLLAEAAIRVLTDGGSEATVTVLAPTFGYSTDSKEAPRGV